MSARFAFQRKSERTTMQSRLANLLLVLTLIVGLADARGQVTIDGPSSGDVGDRLDFDLGGLPQFDLAKPIGESLSWTDRMRFALSSPDDRTRLDSTIGIDFIEKRWRLRISFIARQPGVYVLAICDQQTLAQHRIVVGGEVTPQPNPTPPKPVPPKNLRAFFLRETAAAKPEDAALVITLRTAHPKLLILDKDQEPGKQHYDPSKPLPQLVLLDGDAVLFRESLNDAAKIAEAIGRFAK
jgi:hypothetical protein